ncbi:uncharacterized protein LOC135829379 [Sycon ciliatum]|uniref:uncharacterized protein LOC135829379 n=1 Tax=Sycon ciliatum TaxID=27933 RepID=UPI0031F69CB3
MASSPASSESLNKRSTRQSVEVPRIEPGRKNCIFCGSIQKRIPGTNKKQSTSQILTLEAEERLRKAAAIRKDEGISIAISAVSSLIAREAYYHKQCYNDFTRESSLARIRDSTPATSTPATSTLVTSSSAGSAEHDLSTPRQEGNIEDFYHLVHQLLFVERTAVSISRLTADYNATVHGTARNDRTKAAITERFGESVTFVRRPSRNRAELVFANAHASEIIASLYAEVEEARDSDGVDDDIWVEEDNAANTSGGEGVVAQDRLRIVYHAARLLRTACQETKAQESSGEIPTVAEANACLPSLLHNFLAWVVTDQHHDDIGQDKVDLDEQLQRHVSSIGQDLLYITSGLPCPKHVVLGLTLHHLYRSEKLLKMLNRFGHTIAYSQVLERETAMAERRVRDGHIVDALPGGIDPHRPFYHVADNNDLNEETLDGKGTTHCTNTVVVQPRASSVSRPDSDVSPAEPARKRKRTLALEPEVLPELVCPTKVNPERREAVDVETLDTSLPHCSDAVAMDDFIWQLARASKDGDIGNVILSRTDQDQTVPAWSAFNALLQRQCIPPRSAIGYCPVVNSSPTDMSTVYAILRKCLGRCANAGLPFSIIVVDQAIYAKALDIINHRPDEFSPVVLRLGAFHAACTFLAIIGKRFRDAGLLDLFVESGIAGPSSASSALDGTQYNRAVRLHKVVAEALHRMRWQQFVQDADPTIINLAALRSSLTSSFKELQSCVTDDNSACITASPEAVELHKQYTEYCRKQAASSEMFNFWSSYIAMVSLLLRFLRASRMADWKLHLQCVLKMLPWCFAYDRQNYARYMSYYWLQMTQLPTTHPEADRFLQEGGFSVQRSDNPFAQVPSDQAIEQSINRATKTVGGIIGFSRHPATVQRWVLTAHDRAAVADVCSEHCGMDSGTEERDTLHKECQTGRMARDENDVVSVVETVSKFLNPFASDGEEPLPLTQFASGIEAPHDVAQDLLHAESRGHKAFTAFLSERLLSGASEKQFHDPLKKLQLKTFTLKKQKKKTPGSGQAEILRSDRSTFSRIALIAQTRQMDMRHVLSYPLGPLPWALATTSGSLVKTSKSALLPLLTDKAIVDDSTHPHDGALIVDAMALLRSMKTSSLPSTFAEYAECILDRLCKFFARYARVDFVVDTYRDMSIKNLERSSRAASGTLRQHITGADQRLPRQFAKFLAVGDNKEELIAFLAVQWQRPAMVEKVPEQRELVVTSGSSCVMIKRQAGATSVVPVPDLECSHEEADTRLLLHASHAGSAGYPTVTVKSPDTDVAVLAAFARHCISGRLYFLTGTGNKVRCIDMATVSDELGPELCQALPGFHAFTGCDSTSAFAYRGKKAALKILQSTGPVGSTSRQAFTSLGKGFEPLTADVLLNLETFVCSYYKVSGCSSVNDARYELFCTKTLQSNQLPPCKDAFLKHAARANYQAAIWRQCIVAQPAIPAPQDNGQGWCLDQNGDLAVDWLSIPPAPHSVLEFLSCGCKTGCGGGNCSCRRHMLLCTDACSCHHHASVPCKNCPVESAPGHDEVQAIDEGDLPSDTEQQ